MDAVSLYRAGQLMPAIAALGDELKKQPLDARRRTFLFELLCFAGEYDRAGKQLDVLSDSSAEAAAGTMVYRSALHAERTRQEMFAEEKFPLGSALPPCSGRLNGEDFSELTDADPRIGAHLEAFIAGSYTWIPFAYIESVETEAPKRLRDLLWLPAILHTTSNFRLQDLGEVLLPVISPLSWKNSDDAVRLGRATVWNSDPKHGDVPFGQKLLLCGDKEELFLQMRSLNFDHVRETVDSATTG